MGIFKKKSRDENLKNNSLKRDVPPSIKHTGSPKINAKVSVPQKAPGMPSIKKDSPKGSVKKNSPKKSAPKDPQKKALSIRSNKVQPYDRILNVHQDIRDLLWIGDGENKNYSPEPPTEIANIDGIRITFFLSYDEEPSLLFLNLPVSANVNFDNLERPPYFPHYKDLYPEQKGLYWKLLTNPYDESIDIGYVFILYYGLERHLMSGNFEKAFDVIIKLRNVHTNKSFQSYSANALILTCLYHQRVDLVIKFMASLDKAHEYAFSDNLFLLCKYSLSIPLTPEDIMRLAKSFEFTNLNYIKKYPDIFEEELVAAILQKYDSIEVYLEKIITPSDFKKLKKQQQHLFANMSISRETIEVPLITEFFKLKKDMYDLLTEAHESTKVRLAELRKAGQLKTAVPPKKEKVIKAFDTKLEKELLKAYSKRPSGTLDSHFSLIALQDFYYKARDIDEAYLEECISYCLVDISNLPAMLKDFYEKEVRNIKAMTLLYDKNELQQKIDEIPPFYGSIPAFSRLAIIYEKRKDYQAAVEICDEAIEYYKDVNFLEQVDSFEERKKKIISKQDKA